MQAFNSWRKLNIHRGKIAFLVIFLIIAGANISHAQRQVGINNPNYDDKFLSYGFLIGIHTSAYQIKHSNQFIDRSLDSLYSISPKWSAGFSLGFIVNMHLADFLDVRVLPTVAFYEHSLDYQRLDAPPVLETVETTVVELPVLLKYKSERRGNTRMYLVGGVKPGYEAAGKNDVEFVGDDNLSVKEFNLSMDVGFGIDIYYPLFKFSPEIRFSRGITNILGSAENQYSAGIDRINTNTITLYLLFQ
ncbi:type IX secretion/gliding motility protein PorT/SprT [Fulvivirga sediminis]|uniref:PorT family protein n=1 Tax=Fulvivirga sediminis TaxID=2803949 RepID=A0A937K0N3_9BACT|nr:porin family protein [Fulvivirga sediminis]MBL3656470.1 PorT family protein [Fulvivirga sediminis]